MPRVEKTQLYSGIIVISWILILAISPLRQMFLAQTIRGGYEYDLGGPILPSVIPRKKPDFTQLANEYPTNLSLQLQKIGDEQSQMDTAGFDTSLNNGEAKEPTVNQQTLDKQYDEFPNKFPHSLLALVYSLNHSFSEMKTIRRGGPLSDPDSYEKRKKGIPSPERVGQRNYTQQQWQHVIHLCKEGQRLDPRNAYFDVVEAYWQFAEFHDDAAWAAIQRAAAKPVFNLYDTDFSQNTLQAYQIAFGRPLYWEEIEDHVNYGWVYSGRLYESMREMGRWMEWEGIKAQLHGNNEKALKIYNQLIQVMHLWQQTTASIMSRMVAVAIETMALQGPMEAGVKPDKNIKQHNGITQVEGYFSAFKNYALSLHHSDQLRYAEIAWADFKAEMASSPIIDREGKHYLAGAFAGFFLWRASVLLLLLLCGSLLTWLLTTTFLKVLFSKKIQNSSEIDEGEYWRGALSFAALPASLILIIGYALSVRLPLNYWNVPSLHILNDSSITPWWLTIFGILTPLIFGTGYLLNRVAMRNQKSGTSKILFWKRILGIAGSLLFVIFWATLAGGQWPFDFGSSQASTDFIFGIPNVSNNYGMVLTLKLGASGVIVGIIFYLFFLTRRWVKIDDKATAISDFYSLLYGSAIRWLALGSVLYLLMLAIAIPVRRPLQKEELKKVTQGETAIWKAGR